MILSHQDYQFGCITHLARLRMPWDRILGVVTLPRKHSYAILPEIGDILSAAN